MNKFRNQKYGAYDSKKEAKRGAELALLEQAGEIRDLKTQCVFVLVPSQRNAEGRVIERPLTYRADFVYRDKAGELVVEDVKSPVTRKLVAYIIKRKLMRHLRGIGVREI